MKFCLKMVSKNLSTMLSEDLLYTKNYRTAYFKKGEFYGLWIPSYFKENLKTKTKQLPVSAAILKLASYAL